MSRQPDDRGAATLVGLGFGLVAILVVGLVVDVSTALLARSDAQNCADAAALAAGGTVDSEWVASGAAGPPRIDGVAAPAIVASVLTRMECHARLADLAVEPARVRLTLVREVPLPLLTAAGLHTTTVLVTATATPRYGAAPS